jgi:hypothetical protein
MSDPVPNIEIEDVLSSIRRLVSEETGSQPRPEPVRQPPVENRLVLTPSLRVMDEPEAPSVTVDEVDEVDDIHQLDDETPWNDPDATLFRAAQIEPDFSSEFDPDDVYETSVIAEEDADELIYNRLENAEDQGVTPLASVLGTLDVADQSDGESTPEAETEWLDEVDNEPVQHNAIVTDETDHDDPQVLAETDLDLDKDVVVLDSEPQIDDLQLSAEQDDHEDVSLDDAGQDDLTPLSAKIAALETAIGETQDQWEPDGAAGDDYAGTPVRTLRWQDHEAEVPDSTDDGDDGRTVDQDVLETAELDFTANDEDASDLDFLVGDDSLMDEESLRELVADIVREELQGALGERITRNVRKLVRREIHRALTTQQLD